MRVTGAFLFITRAMILSSRAVAVMSVGGASSEQLVWAARFSSSRLSWALESSRDLKEKTPLTTHSEGDRWSWFNSRALARRTPTITDGPGLLAAVSTPKQNVQVDQNTDTHLLESCGNAHKVLIWHVPAALALAPHVERKRVRCRITGRVWFMYAVAWGTPGRKQRCGWLTPDILNGYPRRWWGWQGHLGHEGKLTQAHPCSSVQVSWQRFKRWVATLPERSGWSETIWKLSSDSPYSNDRTRPDQLPPSKLRLSME